MLAITRRTKKSRKENLAARKLLSPGSLLFYVEWSVPYS
jgi:hypothetical protein